MAQLKRLATADDSIVEVPIPISDNEIKERVIQYPLMNPKRFATKFSDSLFKPIHIIWGDKTYHIQMNFCTNPYCKSFGLDQLKYETKGKPSRYKLSGSGKSKTIYCNSDPVNPNYGMTLGCHTRPFSNWSVAEEISRLVKIEFVKNIEPEYEFHKEGCILEELTPFSDPKSFYKQGKSKVGAPVLQCKSC
ncbi:hypothetical protein [Aquibacillus albus]|uniref:Uncharacterized protein n=1 Tax=Aquibacillus albus TaxID=1168171 RepID=A0ABS2MZD9_9BACI|nr:hypothetical protein [Aquibacillus albus]MBM7571201.1 hypothetical protein [Aquibacillus albus]